MQSKGFNGFYSTILRASVAVTMLAIALPARAALERVGPINNAPTVGSYPAWYQDTTGVALEFCDPLNAAELDGGWCTLVTGDAILPEAFPTNYGDEHFYFDSVATLAPNSGGKALLVMALEAAFSIGPAAVNDQITFGRIRLKLTDIPVSGTYRFIYPYGEESIDEVAGAPRGIFFTSDIGIGLPGGPFDGALKSALGPFLSASATPGGPEMPALTASNPTPDTDPAHFGGAFAPTAYPGTGKAYLADPARLGPVTGSPFASFTDSTGAVRDHNIFRIEGPPGSALGGFNADGTSIDFIETTDFSLAGRVMTDTLPGRVTVDRASYTASATANKLDVFASGFQTTQGRLPAQPRPAPVLPQLSFFGVPCGADAAGAFIAPTGVVDTQMVAAGTNFWAQTAPAAIPAAVCVKDASARNAAGQLVPAFFQAPVTDEIVIAQAAYNPTAGTLTVNATSSDTTATPPTLTLAGFADLAGGQIVVSPLAAPPAKVTVRSSKGGSADLAVVTGALGRTPPAALTAVNDSFTIAEDSGATILAILANDTNAAGGTVTFGSQPRLGTATINADGSVTYTPSANANGNDAFTYQVTTAVGVSNVANVAISITPVNDVSTAVNDGPFSVNVGVATALPNLLDNDIDPDGRADMVAAVIVAQPVGATATSGAGGVVTFSAATAGTYTFTYRTQDSAGALSANTATVTVSAINSDVVVVSSALFRTDKKRWVVTGTANVPGQTISLTYADGAQPGFEIGQVAVDATGAWTLDVRGVTGAEDPTTLTPRPTRIRATSSLTGTSAVGLTIK